MSITGIGSRSALAVQAIGTLRAQMTDLQRQLGTGKKSVDYAGLGLGRGLAVGLRSNLSAISGYEDTITNLTVRLNLQQTALTRISDVGRAVKSATQVGPFEINTNGQTTLQRTAFTQLDEILGLLNAQAGDRYLFSGRAVDKPAVESTDRILNGYGTLAGFKQVMSERNQADLGNGLGRLTLPAITNGPATLAGTGATLLNDAQAVTSGNQDLSALSSAGGTLVLNGVTINIPGGSDELAVQAAINGSAAGVTATFDGLNQLVLTSADADTPVDIGAASTLLGELGLAAGVTPPTNLLTQVPALSGQTMDIQIGTNPPNAPLNITFGTGVGEISTLNELTAALGGIAGGTAIVGAGGNITITAGNNVDAITITGTADPATFGLAASSALPSNAVAIAEDAAGHPFGFKLSSVNSGMTGTTATGPTGTPATITVNIGQNPLPGEKVRLTFTLPDGSTEDLTLTATTNSPPAEGEFTIGATAAATATNFQTALNTGVTKLASTALTAASSIAAAHDFFDVGYNRPPMRIAGPPFATATALTAGTPTNTVTWYTGEIGISATDSARGTAVARVDESLTVTYGARGNEEGIRWIIENVAVYATVTYSTSDPNAQARFAELNQRLGSALDVPPGIQTVDDIEAELAGAQITIKAANDRHQQTKLTLSSLLSSIEDAPKEETAVQLLALQTQLEASLRTTAMLYQISMVNYL
jgi:flagellin-like hook-associated protein FlgL